MNKNCLEIIYLIAVFTFLCVTTAFANIDMQTASIVSKLQGQWYDENGNVAPDFEGNTVNSYPIVVILVVRFGSSKMKVTKTYFLFVPM